MNKMIKGVSLCAVLFGALAISGCSSNAKIDQISSDVQVLNQKVDSLSVEVRDLHAETEYARAEAQRANERLDNAEKVTHYKK